METQGAAAGSAEDLSGNLAAAPSPVPEEEFQESAAIPS
jgi:hypothetical protein